MRAWLTEGEKFSIGAFVVWLCFAIYFGLMLAGCASVFDAPIEPLQIIHHVDYFNWKPSDIQPCVIAYQGPWLMVDEVRNCRGWIPI